ncbi:GL16984 [Drosophila persimilis]|uniref:GL16984 n=1 Tax=Drosophila persimilis TaxID=7234 RepID=B4GH95_DROPE|nr:GL16984 [Drosophila persimilis]
MSSVLLQSIIRTSANADEESLDDLSGNLSGLIYLRIAPHSTLVLIFFDELIALREKYDLHY